MSRTKRLVAACFAALTLSAAVSTSAFAGGQWDINGTPLAAKATAGLSNILVLNEGKLSFKTGAEGIELICKGHEIAVKNGVLIGPEGVLASNIVFSECKTQAPGGGEPVCKLGGTTISTIAIHGLAHLDGTTNALILVLPETKTTFTTIKLTGETCALPEVSSINGGFHILIHEAATPQAAHRVLAFSLTNQLKFNSSEATLAGLVGDLKLTSGASWNFL